MTNAVVDVQPPTLPRWRPFWVSVGIVLLIVVMYLALLPLRKIVPGLQFSDKIAHFLVFAGLMVWFAAQVRPERYIWVLLALLSYGAGMEVLQALRPHRAAEFADLIADAGGLAAGWWLCRLGLDRWPHWIEGWFERS